MTDQVKDLLAVCDNTLYGLAAELATKACDTVRSCVGGALTAVKEIVEVASEVHITLFNYSLSHGHHPVRHS